ncbi:MAG: hypothetical protein IT208_11355 [Chthonomonadales bacterium]|nr:hypothetical protein [Chthonomonadales bacterium]
MPALSAWGYRSDGDAGLMLVGARYHDAQAGRFVTRDTLLNEHPYLYCEHEPVGSVDPSGHRRWQDINWHDVGHWCWDGFWTIVGGASGELGGSALGALVGTVTLPFVGTVGGGVIGGFGGLIIGGTAGVLVGEVTWRLWFEE